ncbi:galactose oxidase [Cyclobacterium sp.]|uniref:galactose oxidase n=1 Tax=Cyclobacterium sp. TaxID=1966343 RepID=UPI0019878F69|nr:galactose oxidase [Cyclobacterium sp.]MBD3628913.1 galactose oxidase [Cyclobacterium sp.]
MKSCFQKYLLPIFIVFSFSGPISGQYYGLSFASSEAVQDLRTGLDLSPGKTLCFDNNFQLSFDISFQPDQLEYFGYIFRIINQRNQNFDLISNLTSPDGSQLVIINQGNAAPHSFDLENTGIFNQWAKFTFDFDLENRLLTYSFLGIKKTEPLSFEKNSCFKILFGSNDYPKFKTTDVPPMNIRNISIHEGDYLRYEWLLDEYTGTMAKENIEGQDGQVENPLWLKKMRMEWKLLKSFSIEGPISVAFEESEELIHFVGLDSLISFSCANNQMMHTPYESGRLYLLRGNQSLFNQYTGQLYTIYLDQQKIAAFDDATRNWDKNFDPPERITDNWQFNKFYSRQDSSIYLLGGYGHFIYKNKVKRYHIPTATWDSIMPSSDSFVPRYLSALGQVDSGAYILGGYGTETGQQIHNPTNLYDILYFNVKDKTFEKITELKIKNEEFVFANSLIIQEKSRTYYGLNFSKHLFNSNLQLIKGSLDSADYSLVGNKIPYKFYDINAFADLFYSPNLDRFFAVTLFHNTDNQTEVAIYSIANPPLPLAQKEEPSWGYGLNYILLLVAGLVGLVGVVLYVSRMKLSTGQASVMESNPNSPISSLDEGLIPDRKNIIYLFGVFQMFDSEGNDITKNFTPLIRELFLVILLFTIRWERGISSEKLKDLLWFDKTAESARNNRSVNIAKLKAILAKVDGCHISKETGYWKVNTDPTKIGVDYLKYHHIVQDKSILNKSIIQELIAIVHRGGFLSNLEHEWLDSFKAEISNEVIDIYIHFANSMDIAEDPEFMIEIANYISYFDLVNEEAMMLKCKALAHLGKHSLAKKVFDNFRKEYKNIYNEDFIKDFQTILD